MHSMILSSKTKAITRHLPELSCELISGGRFNNSLWRMILDRVVCEIDVKKIGIQVISPFGFEVFGDNRFLRSDLRRFYCYIGIPSAYDVSIDSVCKAFEHKLCSILESTQNNFYNQLVLKVIGDKFIKLRESSYLCKNEDRLIDVQCRHITTSVLDDYVDYIICSLSSIHENKDEPKEFFRNARFRNRTYQLYVMLEKIFGKYVNNLNSNQLNMLNFIYGRINNKIDIFYDDLALHKEADIFDERVYVGLIKPRVAEMISSVQKSDDIINIRCMSYHVSDLLSISISRDAYLYACEFIKKTYQLFV